VQITIRPARVTDVRAIRALVEPLSNDRVLVSKDAVTYYEALQQFLVAEVAPADLPDATPAGQADASEGESRSVLVGFGALHVLWEDLAEVRTLATDPTYRRQGIGHVLLEALLDRARQLGVKRVFCLTFEVSFFAAHGFSAIEGTPVEPDVYAQLLRSYDEGVAEFLDLDRVKPNTLGNTRMLRLL
jgi:amino-acid N-acetyltransferase